MRSTEEPPLESIGARPVRLPGRRGADGDPQAGIAVPASDLGRSLRPSSSDTVEWCLVGDVGSRKSCLSSTVL